MANKKEHLTYEERFCIEKLLKAGCSLLFIARTLDRGISTISKEVRKSGGKTGYQALIAKKRSYLKQYKKKEKSSKVLRNTSLQLFVDYNLSLGLSAEGVSNLLKDQISIPYASSKSIRKYVKLKGSR